MAHREVLSAVEERLTSPTSRGLAEAVSAAIRDGVVEPGDRLPPIREVARQLALSPTTVSSAWRLLTRSGLVRTDGRRGTRAVDRTRPALTRYRTALDWQSEMPLDLSSGIPDARLLPALERLALPSPLTPQGYLAAPVLPALRDAVLADWPCPAPEITVVDGAMDALELVVRTQVEYGDPVAVEDPCFPLIVDLLESVGAQVVPVELDEEGMRPDALARALDQSVTAVILQPRGQNPTGVTTTRDRARALAGVLHRSGALIVEDDSTGPLSISPPVSLGEWLPDRVVHVRSYSKSHGPDLRIAVMSGPRTVLEQVQARRQLGQGWTSRLLQSFLAQLLVDPVAIATVERARDTYAGRRQRMVDLLAARGITVGGTEGLNLWVPVQEESAALVRLARARIGVAPGSAFSPRPGHPPHVRVTVGLVPVEDAPVIADLLAGAARPRPGLRPPAR